MNKYKSKVFYSFSSHQWSWPSCKVASLQVVSDLGIGLWEIQATGLVLLDLVQELGLASRYKVNERIL